MKTFYNSDASMLVFISIILAGISAYMFSVQIFAAIAIGIVSFINFTISLAVISRIDVDEDGMKVHKIFDKKTIFFKDIKNINIENRWFIGGGTNSSRKSLVINYTEDLGYGDELVYPFDDEMYNYLKEKIDHLQSK